LGLQKLQYYIPTQIWDPEDGFWKSQENQLKDC
jgi:hypothetical protein